MGHLKTIIWKRSEVDSGENFEPPDLATRCFKMFASYTKQV
jgi:hypothetical protein